MKKHNFLKNLALSAVIILYVIYQYRFSLFGEKIDMPVAEMLKYNILGPMTQEETNMVMALEGIAFMVYFHFIFGTYISRFFEHMPAYRFSRIGDRGRWFLGKCAELFVWTVVYVFFYLGSHLWAITRVTTALVDEEVRAMFVILWIICVALCYTFAILINLFQIIWNKLIGFVVCYTGILFCLVLPMATLNFALQFINPFTYMQILEERNGWLWAKLIYLGLLAIGAVVAGTIFVKKYDISLKEVD